MNNFVIKSIFVIGALFIVIVLAFSIVALQPQEEDHDHGAEETSSKSAQTEEGHGGEIHIDEQTLAEFDVEFSQASSAEIKQELSLNGEVMVNEDNVAHVLPMSPGVVVEINKGLGERVRKGEVLAVLNSRELAETKSAYLSAVERRSLAKTIYNREKKLWDDRITSEQEYNAAKNALIESQISVREAEEILHALGFGDEYIHNLPNVSDKSIARYDLTAPISGIVTDRHATLGELLPPERPAFIITDMSKVWVDLSIYQQDLSRVKTGMKVSISSSGQGPKHSGSILFIDPQMNTETRTACARVVLDNADGSLRPGQFVTADLEVDRFIAEVAVPLTALVRLDSEIVIFVVDGDHYHERHVELGRKDSHMVEILSGLKLGEQYISKGGFTIKSELAKGSFGDGHAH